ncbi:MAG TPA: cyclic lactone autoinducer peptide [Pseudobacteroides sp.]|nr:cyclic lactone autoinducer peptide [Pseudobacteroides sp.]
MLLSSALFIISVLVSSTACAWIFYQPKTPKCFRK